MSSQEHPAFITGCDVEGTTCGCHEQPGMLVEHVVLCDRSGKACLCGSRCIEVSVGEHSTAGWRHAGGLVQVPIHLFLEVHNFGSLLI